LRGANFFKKIKIKKIKLKKKLKLFLKK